MFTLARFSSCFSSANCLHFSLYVSNSTFNTLFSCCNESIRFFSCSIWEAADVRWIGPPSIELVSLSSSLALSAIASCKQEQCGIAEVSKVFWHHQFISVAHIVVIALAITLLFTYCKTSPTKYFILCVLYVFLLNSKTSLIAEGEGHHRQQHKVQKTYLSAKLL